MLENVQCISSVLLHTSTFGLSKATFNLNILLFIQYPLLLCFHVMQGVLLSENAPAHQWGHVSSVHLPRGDLLLRRGHGADIVGVRATDRAGPYYTRQCDGAVLHTTYTIELLLQNC